MNRCRSRKRVAGRSKRDVKAAGLATHSGIKSLRVARTAAPSPCLGCTLLLHGRRPAPSDLTHRRRLRRRPGRWWLNDQTRPDGGAASKLSRPRGPLVASQRPLIGAPGTENLFRNLGRRSRPGTAFRSHLAFKNQELLFLFS